MIALNVILEGDGCWADLADRGFERAHKLEIAALPHGMKSGKPSVAVRCDLPDGRAIIAETSLALLLTAADALRARYGDPRTGGTP